MTTATRQDEGLSWTQRKPTKPGWYWVKAKRHEPQVLRFEHSPTYGLQPVAGQLSTEGWEWFHGPLNRPTHTKPAQPNGRGRG